MSYMIYYVFCGMYSGKRDRLTQCIMVKRVCPKEFKNHDDEQKKAYINHLVNMTEAAFKRVDWTAGGMKQRIFIISYCLFSG